MLKFCRQRRFYLPFGWFHPCSGQTSYILLLPITYGPIPMSLKRAQTLATTAADVSSRVPIPAKTGPGSWSTGIRWLWTDFSIEKGPIKVLPSNFLLFCIFCILQYFLESNNISGNSGNGAVVGLELEGPVVVWEIVVTNRARVTKDDSRPSKSRPIGTFSRSSTPNGWESLPCRLVLFLWNLRIQHSWF